MSEPTLSYRPLFDPDGATAALDAAALPEVRADRRDGAVYVYNDKIKLALNVALVTGRPLLVRGPSGTGKSTLAMHAARQLRWRYYSEVITSRTQARDLLWRFDTLRRLSDSHAGEVQETYRYIQPGPLWWAFNREHALRRGVPKSAGGNVPLAPEPDQEFDHECAVVLLDEIDKADPDVPNNLLVALGSFRFTVSDLDEFPDAGKVVAKRPPLVVITTNDERELPAAFLRRCVLLELDPIDVDWLVRVAGVHFPDDRSQHEALFRKVAEKIIQLGDEIRKSGEANPPSTAEYLDALDACIRLNIRPDAAEAAGREQWDRLVRLCLRKRRLPAGAGG